MGWQLQVDKWLMENAYNPWLPEMANRLIYDTLMFVIPPTLVATIVVFLLRGHSWSKDLQRYTYYGAAALGIYSHVMFYYGLLMSYLYDPTFSLTYDLWGDSGRALIWNDSITIIFTAVLQIWYDARYTHEDDLVWRYYALSLVGAGLPLWMLQRKRRVVNGKPLRIPDVRPGDWRLWITVSFASLWLWMPNAYVYYMKFRNFSFVDNAYSFGNTNGTSWELYNTMWGSIAFLPRFTARVQTIWQALALNFFNFYHIGFYMGLQLGIRYAPKSVRSWLYVDEAGKEKAD